MFGAIAQAWYDARCSNELQSIAAVPYDVANEFVTRNSEFFVELRGRGTTHLNAVATVCRLILSNRDSIMRDFPETGDYDISLMDVFLLGYVSRYPMREFAEDFMIIAMTRAEIQAKELKLLNHSEVSGNILDDIFMEECAVVVEQLSKLAAIDLERDEAYDYLSTTEFLQGLRIENYSPSQAVCLLIVGNLSRRRKFELDESLRPFIPTTMALGLAAIATYSDDHFISEIKQYLSDISNGNRCSAK